MKSSAAIAALLMVMVVLASALAPIAVCSQVTTRGRTVPGEEDQNVRVIPHLPVSGVSEDSVLAHLASSFTENAGQLENEGVLYYASSDGLQVGFGAGGVLFVLRSQDKDERVAVRLTFPGSNAVAPAGRGELGYRSNFFMGSDASAWRTGVRAYGEVVYEGLYDGIDLVYRVGPEGLKYDLIVYPGADPRTVEMSYEGTEGLWLGTDGALRVQTGAGDITDARPVAWTEDGAPVPCVHALLGPSSYGFRCGPWDTAQTLVIDPLVFSTYLGGSDDDYAEALAVDQSGSVYVAGWTESTDFPTTMGVIKTGSDDSDDAFVAKLDPSGGSLVYATYIGGSDSDHAHALAVDSSGNAYLTGDTWADWFGACDFPTTAGAFQTSYGGSNNDAYVAKIGRTGDALLYSTFLGGSAMDWANGIAVDASGNAYVAGFTASWDFHTTPGAFKHPNAQMDNAFVSKLNPSGSALVYSTVLGGSYEDTANAIAVDSSGSAYVVGYTYSNDLPTTAGAFQVVEGGGNYDAFVVKLNPAGSALLYATYLGGGSSEGAHAIAVDTGGAAYVAGGTDSTDFPTTAGANRTACGGYDDAFVAKLSPSGGSLVYSTYLGGGSDDCANAIAVDTGGNAYVAGGTESEDFPAMAGAIQSMMNGRCNAFLAKLDAAGSSLLYATYLGGTYGETGAGALAVDPSGTVCMAGSTDSDHFPVKGGVLKEVQGGSDAFVTKMRVASFPVTIATSPPGLDLEVDGRLSKGAVAMRCGSDSPVHLNAVSPQGNSTVRYNFTGWSDGGAQSHGVYVTAPEELTATFGLEYAVTIETDPPGLEVTVDRTSCAGPYSGWWGEGAPHVISAPSPQVVGDGTRFVFERWSDGGTGTHIASLKAPGTLTATFTEQHLVTVATDPPGLEIGIDGTRSTSPASRWWAEGSSHEVSVNASQAGHDFLAWSDGGGAAHTHTVAGPTTLVATFTPVALIVTAPAEGQAIGGKLRISGEATEGATIQLRVDNGTWKNLTTPTGGRGWSYDWDTKAVANGAHTIDFRSVKSGQESSLRVRHVTVSNAKTTGAFGSLVLLLVVVALIAIIVAVILVARRRRGPSVAPASPPPAGADPQSAGPPNE